MFEEHRARRSPQLEGPYRSPARDPGRAVRARSEWAVLFIDGCMVLVIALTVLTIGRWPTLVDGAARRFLGF